MELKASQIASAINEIYDGVERSRCGKIQADDGNINTVPMQTFLMIISNVFPKTIMQSAQVNIND